MHEAQGEAHVEIGSQARHIQEQGAIVEGLRGQVEELREARGRIEAERDQARQQAAELADLRARVARIPAEAQEPAPVGALVGDFDLEPTPKPKAPTRRRGGAPQGQTGDQA